MLARWWGKLMASLSSLVSCRSLMFAVRVQEVSDASETIG